jgi:branched-chain amino acid transport system ATP-binding protein
MSLLELECLQAGYGPVSVLRDIDLQIAPGDVLGVLGANGAGKSTLMRAIAGLIPCQRGRILLDGKDITSLGAAQRVRLGIALVPEGRLLFPPLSVYDHLWLGSNPSRLGRPELRRRLEEVLALFPVLAGRVGALAGVLSGGQQQMLAIGRALMTAPKLLLLDEPSLGLAPALVIEIFRNLVRINRENGVSILLVEQNATAALDVVHHAYLLENGRVVMEGASDVLKKNPDIKDFYLVGAGARNYHEVKHYRRRKRWLA